MSFVMHYMKLYFKMTNQLEYRNNVSKFNPFLAKVCFSAFNRSISIIVEYWTVLKESVTLTRVSSACIQFVDKEGVKRVIRKKIYLLLNWVSK